MWPCLVVTLVGMTVVPPSVGRAQASERAAVVQTPQVVISTELNGNASPVVVDTGTMDSGSVSVWLRSDVPVESLRLIATIDQGAVTITVDGAQTTGAVALPPSRKVTVAVTGLPRPGTFHGAIVAEIADQVVPITDLTATRRGAYTVTGAAVSATAISATTERTSLTLPLSLESTAPESTPVTVSLEQLVASTGEAVRTTVSGIAADPVDIAGSRSFDVEVPGNGAQSFAIEIQLPVVSEYTGQLRVRSSGAELALSLPIAVTRTGDGTSSLTVLAPDATPVDAFWEPRVSVHLAVTEGNREDVTITGVEVLALARVDGDARQSVDFVARPVGSLPRTVARNHSAAFDLVISGLDRPGRYQGTVSLTTGTTKSAEANFVVLVRRPWWAAFVLITLGVLFAAALRWLGGRRRSLESLERTARLRLQLDKLRSELPLDGAAAAIFAPVHRHLVQRVDQVEVKIRRRGSVDVGAELTTLELQITEIAPEWKCVIEQAASDGVLNDVKVEIAAVGVYLQRTAPDDAATTDARHDLDAIRTKLGAISSIDDEIRRLSTEIDEYAGQLNTSTVDDLRQRLERITAEGSPTDRRQAVDLVGRDWVRALVQRAIAELPAETPRPPGYASDDEWKGHRGEAEQALANAAAAPDRATATDLYLSAMLQLIDRIHTALGDAVQDVVNALSGKTVPPGVQQAAKDVRDALAQIDAAVATKDLGAAQRELGEAKAAYDALRQAASTAGQSMGPAAVVPDAQAPVPGLAFEPTPVDTGAVDMSLSAKQEEDATSNAKKVRLRLRLTMASWTALAVVVIGVLGVQTLWVNDLTWGDPNDLIVAFVWGLGLHTGAAATEVAINRTANIPGAV